MSLIKEALALGERLTELRRKLHACPEIGFDLPKTMEILSDALKESSISHATAGGCLVAHIGPREGAGILLRADCDGLPIREETDLPFAAKNGNMHACGHDMHMTAVLGAAMLLKRHEERLTRPVRLLFQPAEELLMGAQDGIAHGVCDNITEAYTLHVTVGSELKTGTVILPPEGVTAPSADFFEITVQGKGCHGADPASGRDPLAAAAQIVLSLEHIPAREFPRSARAALTVGCLQGGDSHNVIPDSALLKGSLRCYDEEFRRRLKERVVEICAGISTAYRVTASATFPTGCPSLINDKALRDQAKDLLSETLQDRFFEVTPPSGTAGSEDFAFISRTVPSLMLAISAGDSPYPLHHPKVIFDEKCLPYGTAALATMVLKQRL